MNTERKKTFTGHCCTQMHRKEAWCLSFLFRNIHAESRESNIKCVSKTHETSPLLSVRSPPVWWGKQFVGEAACQAQPAFAKVGPCHQILAPPRKVANQDHEKLRWHAVTSYDHQILPPSRQVLSLPSFTWLLLYYFFLYLSFLTLPLCLLFFLYKSVHRKFFNWTSYRFRWAVRLYFFCSGSKSALTRMFSSSSFSACVLEWQIEVSETRAQGGFACARETSTVSLLCFFSAYSLAHVTCVRSNMFCSLYISTSFRLLFRIVQGCPGQFPMVAESN